MWLFNCCKHDWDKITEQTLDSNVSELTNKGITKFTYYPDDIKRTYILVLKCKICGVLDKTIRTL